MNEEYRQLKREILELKTAKPIAGYLQMYTGTLTEKAGKYNPGTYKWKIYFEDVGDENSPIVSGFWDLFEKYDSPTDTIVAARTSTSGFRIETPETYNIYASRPINRIEQITDPGPLEEWTQVRDFYPADMGTTPGWCLQNCRLGFHIYSGTYKSAMADKNAQQANGTLHSMSELPDYIACPVYMYTGIAEGHVVVWDHGTIYSDGTIYPSFSSIPGWQYNYGWGEFCDGARVVQHV